MKHFLSLEHSDAATLESILKQAALFKQQRSRCPQVLAGQHWALIFAKSSTRTRVSFEVGISELGGRVMFLSSADIQLGRGEPIEDTARVLGRMVHGAVIRTFAQRDVEVFAAQSGIPTINALTDDEHPCQIVADLQTIAERLGSWQGKRVAFLGDGDCNVARSWIWASAHLGFELSIGAPPAFAPAADFMQRLPTGTVKISHDPREAVAGADVVYTDVWVSMGKEAESQERLEALAPWQVNAALMQNAKPAALVMHCLPAYRGKEISAEVLEAHAPVIFEQAENRLHAQKAIMAHCVS
jgi:ornithine carbamoyltransferase